MVACREGSPSLSWGVPVSLGAVEEHWSTLDARLHSASVHALQLNLWSLQSLPLNPMSICTLIITRIAAIRQYLSLKSNLECTLTRFWTIAKSLRPQSAASKCLNQDVGVVHNSAYQRGYGKLGVRISFCLNKWRVEDKSRVVLQQQHLWARSRSTDFKGWPFIISVTSDKHGYYLCPILSCVSWASSILKTYVGNSDIVELCKDPPPPSLFFFSTAFKSKHQHSNIIL